MGNPDESGCRPMSDQIKRRDFLNGAMLTIGAALAPPWLLECGRKIIADAEGAPYPPILTGMRGSTASAFEAAHQVAWANRVDWGDVTDTGEKYDLVVVGAGISGLSAARFYQEEFGSDKKILILDNHDDFGGHARRNEFQMPNRTRLCYGGSQSLEDPYSYSEEARKLLKDLGVDLGRFEKSYDLGFFKRQNLADVTYFSAARYGSDKIVKFRMVDNGFTLPGLPAGSLSLEAALAEMPINAEAKRQLAIIWKESRAALARIAKPDRSKFSYFDFLSRHLGVNDPEVLFLLRRLSTDESGIGADALSLAEALKNDLPGLGAVRTKKKSDDPSDLYIHHFPDGNASIARLLVRKLMPHTAEGTSMQDIVLGKMRYGGLDRAGEKVRLRLEGTVVRVDTDRSKKKGTIVTYVKNGKAHRVETRDAILACYNAIIPHIVPNLPDKQKADLKNQVKAPFVYTTVVLKNWQAMKELGIGAAYCPGNLHHIVLANMPVDLGGHRAAFSPDEPMAVTMMHVPVSEKPGLPPKDQFREGRRRLLGMSFDDFEKEIKSHLNGMLGSAGFVADRDIHAITVNRWGHGYAYSGSDLFDEEKASKVADRAKKKFGRVAIANSDSGAMASVDTAIDEAYRAVEELSDQ